MNRLFRQYHRWLATICALPLLLTVVTGITASIAKSLHQHELSGFFVGLHTLEAFHLDGFFPIINGVGLLGLLITGVSMTNLIPKRRSPSHLLKP